MQTSLRMLRYVVATADAGNVTEASRVLNVSQPSVSAAIAQIEAIYGFQLFVRHHARGMTLTNSGQRLINDARLLLSHARDFDMNARAMGASLQGEITVGSFVTLAARFMPGLLSEFQRQHPGISVKLEEGDQQEVLGGLLSGRTEIAISYNYALPEDLIVESLAGLPPHILVGAAHPLSQRKAVSLMDFAEEPFLLLDLPHSRDYFSSLFTACGIEPKTSFRARSFELIRGLIGHGHGYTIYNVLPKTDMAYDGSKVVALPIIEELPPLGVMRLRLARHAMRPAVQAFWDFLAVALPAAAKGT